MWHNGVNNIWHNGVNNMWHTGVDSGITVVNTVRNNLCKYCVV